jgi:metal-responsive CopG/Arc/MetJ family transcriptional regulator
MYLCHPSQSYRVDQEAVGLGKNSLLDTSDATRKSERKIRSGGIRKNTQDYIQDYQNTKRTNKK